MTLNIDKIVGKTVKEVIYFDSEETAYCQDEYNDQCVDIQIIFTDNSYTKIKSVSEDWLQIWTSLDKK